MCSNSIFVNIRTSIKSKELRIYGYMCSFINGRQRYIKSINFNYNYEKIQMKNNKIFANIELSR